MDVGELAADLRTEAERANERRLLVLTGGPEAGLDAASEALVAAGIEPTAATVLTARGAPAGFERLPPERADRLLGTTREAVVLDAHTAFSPNALGRAVGAVDGGGLLVLVAPPLAEWPDRRDDFDATLAVPPFEVGDVTGRFRRRLVETLRTHPGIAIVDLDAGAVERDGLIGAGEALRASEASGETASEGPRPASSPTVPPERERSFHAAAYEACLTADQSRAVRAFERLREPGAAVVVEADRGRGKSAAAGLAAGALAAGGRDVLVTAPAFRNAEEVFVRARALLAETGALVEAAGAAGKPPGTELRAEDGRVYFREPSAAATLPGNPDAVIVDEAAAIPVRLLTALLDAPSIGFCTTVHGYEGAGRGFSVRFRDRLADGDLAVVDLRLEEPIRYARDDPVEAWAFRALLLDARPPVAPLVAAATPETTTYRRLDPDELLADEHLLREAFGLLVLAHYRTEPDDLARLLDAPNLSVRALCQDGHVVSVALLAREGALPAATRRAAYEGSRIRGNMLPDVLTSQLRDEEAGVPVGYRVVRIATHHAARSRGLGSALLAEVRAEAGRANGTEETNGPDEANRTDGPDRADGSDRADGADGAEEMATEGGDEADERAGLDAVDWLGVGYGATPRLLRFWERNGYRTVHLSTTRNDASGEYSALMLRPLTRAGRALATRHARWFRDRIAGVLSDPLDDLDPDVARAALRACEASPAPDLSAREWRVVAGAAYGPGLSDVAPDAFRRLALAGLLSDAVDLAPEHERLLVRKALQAHPWSAVADDLGYVSTGECMRAFGAAFRPLVDAFGDDAAIEERERYTD